MENIKELHVAVANNKGGCGKTTTTINLAQGFANLGYRVLVIDGDKNRTCKNWAQRRESDEPFPVITIREAAKWARPKDIVLYDTEGGIASDEIKDLMETCEYLVIPCKPDVYNQEATEAMADRFIEKKVNFRILVSDALAAGNFARATALRNHFTQVEYPVFSQIIPRSAKMVDAGDSGKTIAEMSGARAISDQFTAVAAQILTDTGFEK